jgi:Na+(H+)/acetate symporter ActP
VAFCLELRVYTLAPQGVHVTVAGYLMDISTTLSEDLYMERAKVLAHQINETRTSKLNFSAS